MTDRNTTTTQIGPGFLGILTLIFITLKLLGYISWSWLWVLAPLWLPLAICLAIFAVVGVIWAIFLGVQSFNEGRSRAAYRKKYGRN